MLAEPGRFIAGNGGVLVTELIYDKASGDKRFLIVDAAMNDLIRPSIYQAYHQIWPVAQEGLPDGPALAEGSPLTDANLGKGSITCDVVGPICETGDYFALGRKLPKMMQGDLLAVFSTGAYGFTMASNYNSRPRPPEVIVEGDRFWVAREREKIEDLIRGERLTPNETYRASEL